VLSTDNLACARGDRVLFQGLSLSLAPGEALHLKGPNGSGKTTLLRTLCGLTRREQGIIRWGSEDIDTLGDDYRRELVYIGHSNGIQGELTVAENLRFNAGLGGSADLSRIDAGLEALGIAALRHRPVKLLSQGQKRRAALARLLVNPGRLWILDEPFNALDADTCTRLQSIVEKHLGRGGLAIITSHTPLALPTTRCRELDLGALA
jgi:heme exporter protein A